MRVILATTCKGRLPHLALTLPENLKNLNGHPDASILVLDYNSADGLGEFIAKNHTADLDSGRLIYYRNNEPEKFLMAHAKNQAHRLAIRDGADIIVNVDADNWAGEGFVAYVEKRFTAAIVDWEAVFLGARGNHRGPGGLTQVRTPPGCFGRIAVTREAFRHAGGYDEIFQGWSPDDKDFAARLANLGYGWRMIHPRYLGAIKHGGGLRFRDHGGGSGSFDESDVLAQRHDLRVVNGGHIGEGVVYRNFSPDPIEIRAIPTRVFGIGLHKTGTTSLARAFHIFGYDVAHWASPHWAKFVYDEMKWQGMSRTLEMHYALCDLPIPLLYKELDVAYPGSKFVLTIRDEDSWLESVKTHWRLRQSWDGDVFSNQCHELLYGTTEFDEAIFRARYRRHNEEVMEYFQGRDNLLVQTINRKATLAKLCAFLDQEILDWPFPHKHRSSEQSKYQET